MFLRNGRRAGIVTLALAAALAGPFAASTASALTDEDKKEIGPLVREYLLQHPEVLQEAILVLEQRQGEVDAEARTKALARIKPLLTESPRGVVIGNPKGDVTLVEFFDYNCSYCKRALQDLQELIRKDPNLRVVLREFPVLGQGSVEAAQVAVAVRLVAPEKYLAFHQGLLSVRGPIDRDKALTVAHDVGIDPALILKQASSPELNATLDESMKLAEALNLTGTPSYVVGDQVLIGAVGAGKLQEAIAETRARQPPAK